MKVFEFINWFRFTTFLHFTGFRSVFVKFGERLLNESEFWQFVALIAVDWLKTRHNSSKLWLLLLVAPPSQFTDDAISDVLPEFGWQCASTGAPLLLAPALLWPPPTLLPLLTLLKLLFTLLMHGATLQLLPIRLPLILELFIWLIECWWPDFCTCIGVIHNVPSPFVWICWILATIDWYTDDDNGRVIIPLTDTG